MARKVVLLHFSGIGGEIFNYIEQGKLQNFEWVMRQGAAIRTETELNSSDIVSKISSLTGLNPGKVGIFDAMLPTKDYKPMLAEMAEEMNQKTLPKLLDEEGIKTLVIEKSSNEMEEKQAFEGCGPDYEKFLDEVYDSNERVLNQLTDSIRDDWNYLQVSFDLIHKIQHVFYSFSDEKHPAYKGEDAKYRNLIKEAYEKTDGYLSALMDEMSGEKDYSIFIFSDKGISPIHKYVHINNLLAEKGVMAVKGNVKSFDDVNWDDTLAYHLGFGQIRVNLKGRERSGIVEQGKEYEDVRKALTRLFDELKDFGGEKVIERVYRKEELYSGLHLADAPDLLLVFKEGYGTAYDDAVGKLGDGIISENKGCWSADHVGISPPNIPGVLIAAGAGIKQGDFGTTSVLNLAPTILYYLGSSIPENCDGKVMEQIFEDKFLKKNKIIYREVKEEIKRIEAREEERVLSEEDEEKIKERLRGLGYMA